MLNCCPICYRVSRKNPIGGDDGPLKNGVVVVEERFFQLFQRHLNEKINSDDGSESSISMFPLKRLKEMGMSSCQGCHEVMASFCDLFDKFKRMELQLDWKVEQIMSLMEGESTLIKYVVESIDQLEVNDRYKKGATETIHVLEKSKTELIAKCSQKLENSFPKVSIGRSSAPSVKSSRKAFGGERKLFESETDTKGKFAKKTRLTIDDEEQPLAHSERLEIGVDRGTSSWDGSNVADKLYMDEPQKSAVATGGKSVMNPLQLISSSYACSEDEDESNQKQDAIKSYNFINIKAKYTCNVSNCGEQFSTLMGFRLHSTEKHNISKHLKNCQKQPDKKKNAKVKKIKKSGSGITINIKSNLQIQANECSPKRNKSLLSPNANVVGMDIGTGTGFSLPILETETDVDDLTRISSSSMTLSTTRASNEELSTNDLIPIREEELKSSEQRQEECLNGDSFPRVIKKVKKNYKSVEYK